MSKATWLKATWLSRLLLISLLLCPSSPFLPPPPPHPSRLASAPKPSPVFGSPAPSSSAPSSSPPSSTVDVCIIGSGIGGLSAALLLSRLHNLTTSVHEAHYLPGGCCHSYRRGRFTFESGPTVMLGGNNPLFEVLERTGVEAPMIHYAGWGVATPNSTWAFPLGRDKFQAGPLLAHGGPLAVSEFAALRAATAPLRAAAGAIPAMAMRADSKALLPLLLRHPRSLLRLLRLPASGTGPFAPYLPPVTSPFLRWWLDALAFSLSGLPASRTPAAALAAVLGELHEEGATLAYPEGGMGALVGAMVEGVRGAGSSVRLGSEVEEVLVERGRAVGMRLKGGEVVRARRGVVCNAPVWNLPKLIPGDARGSVEGLDEFLGKLENVSMTRSYHHLHLALNTTGLDLPLLPAHTTYFDTWGDPTAEQNMCAVSNPCALDPGIAPAGTAVVHAYLCANEDYAEWEGMEAGEAYERKKRERGEVLWRAVESVIPDARERVIREEFGSPLTHERFLRRPGGTYGAEAEDLLANGATPVEGLVLAGDGIFPGIGIPAVALTGAAAANAFVGVREQLKKY